LSHRTAGADEGWGGRDLCYSVPFGCEVLADTTQTIRFAGSGQYQIRPPDVTSYCHCSNEHPPILWLANCPRSRCCRVLFSGCVGRSVRITQASHVLERAA